MARRMTGDAEVEPPPLFGHPAHAPAMRTSSGLYTRLRWSTRMHLGGEVQGVEVQLVVVGERAFHHELRHVVDERVQEQRHEQGRGTA